MKIYYDMDTYAAEGTRSRVALGYFDGVHAGHRAVIGACRTENTGERTVVLTFRENPAAMLGFAAPAALTDNARKAELLAHAGADAVIFADFAALRGLSPADFVRRILCEKLHAVQVSCGYNYRFGSGGAGDPTALRSLCEAEGIAVSVAGQITVDGEPVSSTRIRALLTEGGIARANRMLGEPYAVCGTIVDGNHIGTALGFPTVNLPLAEGLCVPRYGVYAARVTVGGVCCPAIANIGVHPTVGASPHPLCEAYLIDYTGDLYGLTARCELLEFVRPEKAFASAQALREQVARDIAAVRKIHNA